MKDQEFTVITDLAQIPDFKTEQEEAHFWDTHTLEVGMMTREKAQALSDLLPPTRPRPERPAKSNPVSLRLSVDLERRLRVLAEKKGTTYQTLLKEFVLERTYEEEKRLGLV